MPSRASHDRPLGRDGKASILTASDAGMGDRAAPMDGRWEIGLSALVLTGLIVAMTLVIVLGAQSRRDLAQLREAEQVKFLATDFLMRQRTAESSQRGYLVTGNPRYLRGYNAVRTSLPLALTRLEAATSKEPAQAARLARIRSLFDLKRHDMFAAIEKEGADNRPQARSTIISESGFVQMVRIEKEIENVIEFENRIVSNTRTDYELTYFVSISVLVGILSLGVVTFFRIGKFVRSYNEYRSALTDSNRRLTSLVHARTAEIARVNEEIQRYGYIVGHDLRGPLINIIGFTSELQRAEAALEHQLLALKATAPASLDQDFVLAVEQDIPEAIRFIEASTHKMDRLIAAVLKLSREGRRSVVPEPINISAMIEDLVACHAQQIAASRCGVTIGTLPDLISDRLAVELVFGNLIENAVKYLDPHRPGRIEIVGRTEGDRNVYEVIDNGRGIAPADGERVFELFRRAGEPTVAGEGVGLAYVRNAIYRLDGTVTLESAQGIGTRFIISLPARLDAVEQPGLIAA